MKKRFKNTPDGGGNTKPKSLSFRILDGVFLAMAILPLLTGMALKILLTPPSDGINITGAQIYFTIDLPFQSLPITESQTTSWLVILSIFGLCLYLTHGLTAKCDTVRQHLAEWIVEKTDGLVLENMGEYFKDFSPFIAAILGLSAFSSLSSLLGLYPPTSDMNVVGGWAVLVFFLITYYKMKCGPIHYLKSFADPALLTPMNIISEFATPVSMAFRHYGNVMSGAVISVLVAYALQQLSGMIFGWLPGFLGQIPFLRIGIPAVLSVYFDLFSGCLQAFIFATLTMLYVAGAFPQEDYFARKAKKQAKKEARAKAKAAAR